MQEKAAAAALAAPVEAAPEEEGPLHETNEWGIEVVSGTDLDMQPAAAAQQGAGGSSSGGKTPELPSGLQFAMPVRSLLSAPPHKNPFERLHVWGWLYHSAKEGRLGA